MAEMPTIAIEVVDVAAKSVLGGYGGIRWSPTSLSPEDRLRQRRSQNLPIVEVSPPSGCKLSVSLP